MKTKAELRRRAYLYPSPVLIIGTVFQGRPNWSTVAYHGILDANTLLLTIESSHLTTQAIRTNGCFSVNIPSSDMAARADYVGTRGGATCDKSTIFTATMVDSLTPIADECALSYTCHTEKLYEKNGKTYIVATVLEIFAEESLQQGAMLDIGTLNPLLFDWTGYYKLGDYVGRPFSKPDSPDDSI